MQSVNWLSCIDDFILYGVGFMTVIVTFMKITLCNGNIRRHGYRLELAERWC